MIGKAFWHSFIATANLFSIALVIAVPALATEGQSAPETETLSTNLAIAPTEPDLLPEPDNSLQISQGEPNPSDSEVSSSDSHVSEQSNSELSISQHSSEESFSNETSLDQLVQYGNEGRGDRADAISGDAISQVTSISQLSDVQPTDWAFQALQSLVERYGCIVGYPDGTYRGQSALTRYEFAAGLNACLDRISELIAASTADLATREDLATLQRLQEEFAAELATLRGRVDSLESRVAELEANQFSTTTKLQGEAIFAVGVPFSQDEEFDDQTIGGYRGRLSFLTSFNGDDLLRARTQALDFDNYDSFGGNVGATAWKVGSDDGSNDFVLDQLIYIFNANDRIQLTLGGRGVGSTDLVIDTISPFDDDLGPLLGFGLPPVYYFIPGGTGGGAIFQLTDNLSFDVGYAAENDDAPDPTAGSGLFNGDYGAIAQLTFLSDTVDAALVYGNGYRRGGFFTDLGLETGPAIANSYGGYINFKFGSFEIGGGGAYVPIRQIEVGDYDVWSYQAGVIVRDLGAEGNVLGIQAGVAPYASGIPLSALADGSRNQDNNVIVQGFYRFRVTDNILVIPGVAWLSTPDNNDEFDDTFVGLVRTAFTF